METTNKPSAPGQFSGNGRIRRTEQGSSKFGRIGHIKIGQRVAAKTKDGRDFERPESLDYFIATGDFAHHFVEAIADKAPEPGKPRVLHITFPSDDRSLVCYERFECWKGSSRWGWGDGHTFNYWNPKAKQYEPIETPTEEDMEAFIQRTGGWKRDNQKGDGWREILTLRFLIIDLPGLMGFWQFDTSGEATSLPEIRDAFDFVLDRIGTVLKVPWTLAAERVTSKKPGVNSTYTKVKLVPNLSAENMERYRAYIAGGSQAEGFLVDDEAVKRLHAPGGTRPQASHAPALGEPEVQDIEYQEADQPPVDEQEDEREAQNQEARILIQEFSSEEQGKIRSRMAALGLRDGWQMIRIYNAASGSFEGIMDILNTDKFKDLIK